MREIAHATHGTVARARRAARYLYTNRNLAWTFPDEKAPQFLDTFADSDWVSQETELESSSCVVVKLGSFVVEASFDIARRHRPLQRSSGEMYAASGKQRLASDNNSSSQRSVALCRFRVHRDSRTPLTSARGHRARIKSFISCGCWEWTQRGGRWISVESGAYDMMKGSDRSRRDSEDESLRHGRMSAGNPDEARKVKFGTCNSSCSEIADVEKVVRSWVLSFQDGHSLVQVPSEGRAERCT